MPTLRFLHLPIAVKAVLLIAALGLLSMAANWFCLQRLDALDRLNTAVSQHLAPARLALAEAKAAIESFGAATYKLYAAADADQAREAAADMEGHFAAARRALGNVQTDYPAATEDVRRIFQKLDLAHATAADLLVAVKRRDTEQAERMLNFRFDPARDDVTGHMDRLINILGAQARLTEAEVITRGAWLYRTTVAAVIGGTALALAGAFLLTQMLVTRPLRRLARAMTKMAGGDLGIPVNGNERGDEIGAMARAVLVFRDHALALREADGARADERARAEAEKSAALEAVATAFEREILDIAASIGHAATELEAFAREMSAVLDDSHRHAEHASTAAADTNESAAGVAAAIEELSASIGDIGTQVTNAAGVVEEATRCTGDAVTNTAALATTVRDIDQVATLITAIARQTNLLALNATIEASRAGEAGRGFAVVAQEVKALAAQTTEALAQIKDKTMSVGSVIEAVQNANTAMARSMGQVSLISGAISRAVRQQNFVARRIGAAVDNATTRTGEVAATIAGVTELVDRSGHGADQLLAAAAELSRQAAALTRDADLFVNRVRAA